MTKVVDGKEVDKPVVMPNEDDDDDDEDGENAKPLLSSNQHRSGASWQGKSKGTLLSPTKQSPLGGKKSFNDTAAKATASVVGPNTNTTMAMRIPLTETKKKFSNPTNSTTTTPPATSTHNLQKLSPSRRSPSPATLSRRRLQQRAAVFKMGDSSPKPVSVVTNVLSDYNKNSSSLESTAVLVLSERNRIKSNEDIDVVKKDKPTYETTNTNKANMGGAFVKTSTSPIRYSPQKITLAKKSDDPPEERDDAETMRECSDETREEDVPLTPFDTSADFATKRQEWANKFKKKNKVASAQRLHSTSRGQGFGVPTSLSTESATISPVSKALMNSPSKYQHRNDRTMKEIPTELAQPLAQLYAKFDKKRQSNNKGSALKDKQKDNTTISVVSVFKQEQVKNWSPTDSSTSTPKSSSKEVISMTTGPKDMSVSSLREETKLEEDDCTTKDDAVFETQWTSTIDFTTNPSSDTFPDPDMDELFFASNEFDSDDFSDIMSTLTPKGSNDKEENDEKDMDNFHSIFGEEAFDQVNKEHNEEDLTFKSVFGDEVFDQAEDSTLETSTKVTTNVQEEDTQTSSSETSGWVALKEGNFYEWSKQEAERINNERAASEIGIMQGNVSDDIAIMIESFKAGLSPEQQYLFTNIIARYEIVHASRRSELESLMSESSLQQKQIHTLLGIYKQIQVLVAKEQEPTPEPDDKKIECLNVEISNLRLQLAACEAALKQDSGQSTVNTASPKKNFMKTFLRKGSNKK